MSDIEIYNRFYTEFGKNGLKKVLDGFGSRYDRFDQVRGRRQQVFVPMIQRKIHRVIAVCTANNLTRGNNNVD